MAAEEENAPKPEVSADLLQALDIRAGTVVRCEPNEGARKPAYRIWIDFGPGVGVRQSSAQLTRRYTPEDLVGSSVLGVINFPPRRVAGFKSEVLILGIYDPNDPGDVILVRPDAPGAPGWQFG